MTCRRAQILLNYINKGYANLYFMNLFGLPFTIKDAIDVLLVALILFEVYRLLRKSGAVNLFWGIIAFIGVWFMVKYIFAFSLTGALFDRIISVGAIALIVIFQEEIRAVFYRLGSRVSTISLLRTTKANRSETIQSIAEACEKMSRTKTGALIILSGKQDLSEFMDTGERLDAKVSSRMIENIFFKNSPLHDGALIIAGGRLCSAGCILPVSKKSDLPEQFGLRHRAAIGLTERCDAIAIIVSEETGHISVAEAGEHDTLTVEQLIIRLMNTSAV